MALVFQINHDSYRICHGRNMPPIYSYEKLTQILSVTILVQPGLVLQTRKKQGLFGKGLTAVI